LWKQEVPKPLDLGLRPSTMVRVPGEVHLRLTLLKHTWQMPDMGSVVAKLLEPYGTLPEMLEKLSVDARIKAGLHELAERMKSP